MNRSFTVSPCENTSLHSVTRQRDEPHDEPRHVRMPRTAQQPNSPTRCRRPQPVTILCLSCEAGDTPRVGGHSPRKTMSLWTLRAFCLWVRDVRPKLQQKHGWSYVCAAGGALMSVRCLVLFHMSCLLFCLKIWVEIEIIHRPLSNPSTPSVSLECRMMTQRWSTPAWAERNMTRKLPSVKYAFQKEHVSLPPGQGGIFSGAL